MKYHESIFKFIISLFLLSLLACSNFEQRVRVEPINLSEGEYGMLGETVNQWDYILLLVKNDRLNLNVRSYDTVLKDSLHDKLSCIEKICKGQNSRIIQVEDKIFLDYQISNELRTIEIKNRYWEDINTKGLHHVIAEMRSNN